MQTTDHTAQTSHEVRPDAGRPPDPARDVSLAVRDLAKTYGRRGIFRGVNFDLSAGQSLAVTGPNGSGKSTLLRVLCGLMRPTCGSVAYRVGSREATGRDRRNLIGLVAPDLVLYDELSAVENLRFFTRARGLRCPDSAIEALLSQVGLEGRGGDPAGTFSSGMRQRLKYAFALVHQRAVLCLDDPTANLDEAGIAFVRRCIARQRETGILIVATNDREELQHGDRILRLGG